MESRRRALPALLTVLAVLASTSAAQSGDGAFSQIAADSGRGSNNDEIHSLLARRQLALADLHRLAELTNPEIAAARH